MSRQIILIGGMPTAGKSTIAEAVAKHFDLPWISTDTIRTIMRSVADRDKFPAIFYSDSADITAEDFYAKYSAEEVADTEYKQGHEVWSGIKAVIDTGWTWKNGCVIEGINILPANVAETYKDKPNVKAVFLSDSNLDRIKEVIYSRGLFTHPDKYSDQLKDQEVEWVKLFDQKIRDDAVKYNYPLIDISKGADDIDNVLEALS